MNVKGQLACCCLAFDTPRVGSFKAEFILPLTLIGNGRGQGGLLRFEVCFLKTLLFSFLKRKSYPLKERINNSSAE